MKIRIATKEDIDDVFNMTKELAVYEKEGDVFCANKEFFLEHILTDNPKATCYLIEDDDGDVVGMGEIFMTLSTYTSSYKLNLQDFYIQPNSRGKGYGKAFMKFLAKIAKERNCTRVCWGVYSWNELARGLYDKVGISHDDVTVYSMGPEEIEELL